MSVVTEEITGHIEESIQRIEDEIQRLEAARAALLGETKTRNPRTKVPESLEVVAHGKSGPRRKASRGSRQLQVLALVEARPGISSREIVAAAKFRREQVYNILGRLSRAGAIEGDHTEWQVVTTKAKATT
jgi:hypothetical protein